MLNTFLAYSVKALKYFQQGQGPSRGPSWGLLRALWNFVKVCWQLYILHNRHYPRRSPVCCSDGVSVIDWNIQYELWARHKLLWSNFTSSIKYLVITCSSSNNSFGTKTGGWYFILWWNSIIQIVFDQFKAKSLFITAWISCGTKTLTTEWELDSLWK